ncbi:CCD42 protein, partial [Daphoenositta chrysoptera]|nr:CCD42 protein [Daphoenositta chrysoptera]
LEERLRAAFQDKLRLLSVPARDAATLLPSTRVLLKRREVAEVERELQNRREVRAAPAPQYPLPGRCRCAMGTASWQACPQLSTGWHPRVHKRGAMLSAARNPTGVSAADAASGAAPAAAGPEGTAAPRRRERGVLRWHLACPLAPWRGDPSTPAASQPPPTAQFQDVPAMLVHFGVLARVRAALAPEAEAGQERLAQERARLQRYRQETSTELLGTYDELARLHTRLEATRQDVLQWESCWTYIQSTTTQKTLLLAQIKLGVLNLFQLTTAQLRIPTDRAQEDTKAQLDMVLLCMQALADICA